MGNEIKIELDILKTIPYITECLNSGNTLSKFILQSINLYRGSVHTFLPEYGNVKNIYNFEYGGIITERKPSIQDKKGEGNAIWIRVDTIVGPIIDLIESYLAKKDNVCVFDDALSKTSDHFLKHQESFFKIFEAEIYHILFSGANAKQIINAIDNVKSLWPPLIGVLTRYSASHINSLKCKNETITSEQLLALAMNTSKIIVSAYDGEGYLIWNIKD